MDGDTHLRMETVSTDTGHYTSRLLINKENKLSLLLTIKKELTEIGLGQLLNQLIVLESVFLFQKEVIWSLMCIVGILHHAQRLILLRIDSCRRDVFVCLVMFRPLFVAVNIFVAVIPTRRTIGSTAVAIMPHLLNGGLLTSKLLVHELLVFNHFSLLLHHEFPVARLTSNDLAIRASHT